MDQNKINERPIFCKHTVSDKILETGHYHLKCVGIGDCVSTLEPYYTFTFKHKHNNVDIYLEVNQSNATGFKDFERGNCYIMHVVQQGNIIFVQAKYDTTEGNQLG